MTRARQGLTRVRRKLGEYRERLGACYELYKYARNREIFDQDLGHYWALFLDMIDIMRAKII